jgi:predicted phosphoribosyltransferase
MGTKTKTKAVPVAQDTVRLLKQESDAAEVVITPSQLQSMDQYYQEFYTASDEQVVEIMRNRSFR